MAGESSVKQRVLSESYRAYRLLADRGLNVKLMMETSQGIVTTTIAP